MNSSQLPLDGNYPTRYEKHKNKIATILFPESVRRSYLDLKVWKSCVNCINFHPGYKNKETPCTCMLNKQTPPPEIIVLGCEMHEDDIPF